MRPLHAKSHGLLKAELTLYALEEPYRQGLFTDLTTYPAIIRLSTTPGDILPDSISAPRGFAIKVVGVEGFAMFPGESLVPSLTSFDARRRAKFQLVEWIRHALQMPA